ncbi:hypothetical protein F0562_036172 [Nyssa sinensis]|uniref:Uncharacterized protein n=1 Tax=Nyssa sinensis TaxID=561372 RepID=A0A5J5AH78_9ASTE|nr:hypothetical protein F0562_036172 [Nyssa sinensis]
MRLAFKRSWSVSFEGLNLRQITLDLVVAQAMAAILDHHDDTERVNRLQADLDASDLPFTLLKRSTILSKGSIRKQWMQ